MAKHLSRKTVVDGHNRTIRRLIAIAFGLAVLLLVGLSCARGASALDIPGVDICKKTAPFADTPDSGLPGLIGERPKQITTDDSPENIWSTGGFTGLKAQTYDLGCLADPSSYATIFRANNGSAATNTIMSISNSMVALTDSIDRRAWTPGWIIGFLQTFADRAVGIANTNLVLPFSILALILGVGILLLRANSGDSTATTKSVGWMLAVITITSLLVLAPLALATTGTAVTGTVVAAINGGANTSDAQTNSLVKNIQYQGWLRRNFGSDTSVAATKYGPSLLASTRISWAELDAIRALPPAAQPKAQQALADRKAKAFKTIAANIERDDSIAYRHLTGREGGVLESLTELLFTMSACLFRLAVALLMIASVIALVLLAVVWVVATPIILLPNFGRFSGQEIGLGLVNAALRTVVLVVSGAIGSWLFGIYLQACLAPGMSLVWSMLLLFIGTGIAWVAIGPMGKFVEIISLGRIKGHSFAMQTLKAALIWYTGKEMSKVVGRVAGREAAETIEERNDTVRTETVHATIFNPVQPFTAERPTHVDGEPLVGRVVNALPSTRVYERPTGDAPSAPSGRARSDYEAPYERTADNEGADHE